MHPIRVLVAEMVALDRDIVERIAEERPDMTIVGRADGPVQAGQALATRGVDVLLLSASGPGPLCAYLELLWAHPWLGVVVVDPRDGRGVLREFTFVERVTGARVTWSEGLARSIRSAARRAQTD